MRSARGSASAVFSVPTPLDASSTIRIGLYGDSLTAGFPSYEPYGNSLVSTLADEGVSAEVIGCGLSGLTAVELARGLDELKLRDHFGRVGPGLRSFIAEKGPFDLVMIMAGTNDVANPHSTVKEVLASLKSMHKACWEASTPTVALSVPESSVTGTAQFPQAAKKWHAVNNALSAWACAEEGELSLTSPFLVKTARLLSFDKAARARGLWDPDGLHFTVTGSRAFGSNLAPIVKSHLQGEMQDSVFAEDEEPFSPKSRRTISMASAGSVTPERMLCALWPVFRQIF